MIAITVGLAADDDVAGYVAPRSNVIIFSTAKLKSRTAPSSRPPPVAT